MFMTSGKEFFLKRYRELGEEIKQVSNPKALRINTLRISEEKLLQILKAKGVELEKVPYLEYGYIIKKSNFSLGATKEHLLGYFYIQESASQIPVQILDPKQNESIIDCCASPGGKTTQISQILNNKGTVYAYEMRDKRIPALVINLERMGVVNVVVFNKDVLSAKGSFDKILVDAPCSGNYAGDSEWFEKRDYEGIMKSQEIQRKILGKAVELAKKGGIIVYSTCSLEPEENEINIDWILKKGNVDVEETGLEIGDEGLTEAFGQKLDNRISKCRRFWPYKTGTEGFFVCKLRKV